MRVSIPAQSTTPWRCLFVMGTRPEAIKMAPVIHACRRTSTLEPIVCLTGQHREMLAQVTDYFEIAPDESLDLMKPNQSLAHFTARCLETVDEVLARYRPDYVLAQGDTTTVLAASLGAFYRKIPFVHVEAGLRTGNRLSPWPEEFNRRAATLTAALHCAPTRRAAEQLLAEGVPPADVRVTGNTVIDALRVTLERERQHADRWRRKYAHLSGRRTVLITGHRRENFGPGLESLCAAIRALAADFADTAFVYPVHLNPHVREPVFRLLRDCANVYLTDPAPYPEFVWLMDAATVIVTDSGGVQEEAPYLRKPVVVTRDTTERPEGVECGAVQLVGTARDAVVAAVARLLTDHAERARCQTGQFLYGDGHAAERIVQFLLERTARPVVPNQQAA